MTLDNAISDFEKMMKEQERRAAYNIKHGGTEYAKMAKANKKKASEYRQLAEWLKDYKRLLEQQPCEDCISRQAARAKIKSICGEYGLSYEDGERKPATGGSAYALGHAFDDLPPAAQ